VSRTFGMFIALAILSGSCASPGVSEKPGEYSPNPMQPGLGTHRPGTANTSSPMPMGQVMEPTAALTLRTAIALALLKNPKLSVFEWGVRAEEALVLQAGIRPNPEIELEAEGFGGSRDLRGTDAVETSLRLSQLIELGGKRAKRIRVTSLRRDVAAWDYETARLDVLTEVSQNFVGLLAAQERLRLHKDLVEMASQALDTTKERVNAGKVSPLDETRAQVRLTRNRIGLERSRGELIAARKRMAAMWGGLPPSFRQAEGDLYAVSEIPPLEDLLSRLDQNPNLARWETEFHMRQAAIDLERARTIPDVAISGGVLHENETDSAGFVLGLSVSLPLFDRNQGGIREARRRMSQAEEARVAAELEVRASLEVAYESLLSAYRESVALEGEALPGAEAAYQAAQEAYQYGKLGYLDVLEARSSLSEVRSDHIEAVSNYHAVAAEMGRLIGGPLNPDTKLSEGQNKETADE